MLVMVCCGGGTAEPLATYTPYPTYTPVIATATPFPTYTPYPTYTPVIATATPTATVTPLTKANISGISCDVEQLDATIFAASTVPVEEINLTKEWVCLSAKLYFDKPNTNWEMAGPIYVASIDRNNVDSAIELEKVFCKHLRETLNNDNYYPCDPNVDPSRHGCNYGICLFVTSEGTVAGSSISSSRTRDGFYLFISRSHKMPQHHDGYKTTTLHEMFHIFQIASVVDNAQTDDELSTLLGRRTGDNKDINVPWWMEGTAVYIANLEYSRQPGEIRDFVIQEMTRGLWSDYGTGKGNLIDQYLNSGRKLYNFQYGGSDHQVAYRVGSWFVAYLLNQVGEEKLYEFYERLSENGFEKSFDISFGKSYKDHVDDFDIFLTNDKVDILSILSGN